MILKSRLFFFMLGVLVCSISAVFAYSYFAQNVGFTPADYENWNVDNTKDALDSLYDKYHPPITDELKAFSYYIDVPVDLGDIINEYFLRRISSNKTAVLKLIKTDAFRGQATKTNLGYLDISLVKTVDTNSVFYSTQYNASTWSADKIFISSTNSGWCTSNGSVKNQYVGYDFGTNVFVIAITFMNGYPQTNYVPKNVKLQYSDDKTTWSDASTVSTFPNSPLDAVIVNTLTNDAHRYWRIFVIDAHNNSYIEINELKFYGV